MLFEVQEVNLIADQAHPFLLLIPRPEAQSSWLLGGLFGAKLDVNHLLGSSPQMED